MKKIVRMLLRVSSEQQLEADGDLDVQRSLVADYIKKHANEWILDDKEYFEGSKSAYKNTASEREVLQEILNDAKKKEFSVLAAYKDDRIGRLLGDTTSYVMKLKSYGVDVYTVKDGLISPETDDIMGQVMLTFRYANAQKASADTGMRVKDTAQKLVEKGKFMGGKAPYGYTLEYSGEISKHGRALKHLVIEPDQAAVVQYIYHLSIDKELGSYRIAKLLNEDERYKSLAPGPVWKSGTITSILTNPIYAGRTAYKRRERINGQYHRLESTDWIISVSSDETIRIIDEDIWNRTQDKRKLRKDKINKNLKNENATIIKANVGMLPLIDVIYCGYCGRKLSNGSKYSYWSIKGTGERRGNKIPAYKCMNALSGVPHNKVAMFRADRIEPVVFQSIAAYIGQLQEQEEVLRQIEKNHVRELKLKGKEIKKEKRELEKIQSHILVMESHIPDAMQEEYALSLDELVALIRKYKASYDTRGSFIKEKEQELKKMSITHKDWDDIRKNIPTWQDVFLNADDATKRVLVNKLVERIDVKSDEVVVKFKINLKEFITQPRINDDSGTTRYIPGSE